MHGAFKDPKLTVKEICNKIIAFSFFRNTINRMLQPCDFRSLPYFRPDQKFDTLFQTCLVISPLGQTNVEGNVYTLLLTRIQNCTKFRAENSTL